VDDLPCDHPAGSDILRSRFFAQEEVRRRELKQASLIFFNIASIVF